MFCYTNTALTYVYTYIQLNPWLFNYMVYVSNCLLPIGLLICWVTFMRYLWPTTCFIDLIWIILNATLCMCITIFSKQQVFCFKNILYLSCCWNTIFIRILIYFYFIFLPINLNVVDLASLPSCSLFFGLL